MLKISIGCDHRGYEVKKNVIEKYKDKFEFIDCGTNSLDSTDYPIYANRVCKKILDKESDFGILICSSGIGISIAANRHKGIRAALCFNDTMARLTRLHNNSNILCFGADIVGISVIYEMIDVFFTAQFLGDDKYQKRNDMIDE
ncbi:MAG: ribose 5-phosphate isomerase B [Rickettsiales bacterium]|jgi:ribose 5-phosphate isomerase B|nr:ribose 5-phosphate isomerase B [Rickettsiales bacterium]